MNNSVKQRLHSGAVSSRIHFISNALFYLKQIDLQSIFRKHLNVTQHSSSQLYIVGCKISFLFEVSYEYIHIIYDILFSFDVDNGASPSRFPLDGSSTGIHFDHINFARKG